MAHAATGESHATRQPLQPFEGRMPLGINFESGHSLWMYDFERTPTEHDSYRECRVVEPDDTRILHYDTEGADAELHAFDDWDRSVLAEMSWEWSSDRIDITVDGDDGRTIENHRTRGDRWEIGDESPVDVHAVISAGTAASADGW